MAGGKYRPLLWGLGSALLVMTAVCVSGAWFFLGSESNLKKGVDESLQQAATAAANLVDPELHATFLKRDQEKTLPYARAVANLESVRRSQPDIKFVYTCILRNDSVYFVLDPTLPGDRDGDGVDDKSHIMQPYPDASPALLQALKTGKPAMDAEPYTDSWGTFISAYAPFFDPRGRLAGVVGADMELTRYLAETRGMRKAALLGLGLGLFFSLLTAAGVYGFFRFLNLTDAKQKTQADQLRSATARAEEASRAKSDFLAVMSHEIRTPMNGIIGILDHLVDTASDPQRRDLLETARDGAGHLLSLLNGILDYSKIEAGKIILEAIPFDLPDLCRETLGLFALQAEEKALQLVFDASPGMRAWVTGDPGRLRQILANLLGNALKFTERGWVRMELSLLETRDEGGRFEIKVEDTGIGIAGEKIGSLFQEFTQADTSTTRRFGGTGLGLAICKRLAELMGGEITAASTPGEGSTFSLKLPFTWQSQAAAESDARIPKTPQQDLSARNPILVAEDNAVNQKVMKLTLEDLGCAVEFANTGKKALEMATEKAYSLIFMDCRMPEMDGYEATGAIRKLPPPFSQVPIIALTANALEGDKEKCLRSGMDDYAVKPVRKAELEKLIRIWQRPEIDWKGIPKEAVAPPAAPSGLPRNGNSALTRLDPEILGRLFGTGQNPDPGFFGNLILEFLEMALKNLESAGNALAARDFRKLADAAHDLSGSAANFGATALTALCRRLQDAGRREDAVAASDLLGRILEEWNGVERELRTLTLDFAGDLQSRKNS